MRPAVLTQRQDVMKTKTIRLIDEMVVIYKERAEGTPKFTGLRLVDNIISDNLGESRVTTAAELAELRAIVNNRDVRVAVENYVAPKFKKAA
jgi:hypothetical protein